MNLNSYFIEIPGTGVLSTADSLGRVDAAIYATPHFFEDGTIGFIMRDRLSHANLTENPHAHYLFIEQGQGFNGVRLSLKKNGESDDQELISSLSRRRLSDEEDRKKGPKFLVRFTVERALSLIGGNELQISSR